MPNASTIRNYYLAKLREAKAEGMDDHAAAEAAERATRAKYGRVPREGE